MLWLLALTLPFAAPQEEGWQLAFKGGLGGFTFYEYVPVGEELDSASSQISLVRFLEVKESPETIFASMLECLEGVKDPKIVENTPTTLLAEWNNSGEKHWIRIEKKGEKTIALLLKGEETLWRALAEATLE